MGSKLSMHGSALREKISLGVWQAVSSDRNNQRIGSDLAYARVEVVRKSLTSGRDWI